MSSRGFYCIQGFETSSERHVVGFGSKRPVDGCVKREENPHGENSAIFAVAYGSMETGRGYNRFERHTVDKNATWWDNQKAERVLALSAFL